MTEIVSQLITTLSPTALPLVVVILGCFYIYRKIGRDRAETKEIRDKDSLEIHDTLLRQSFEISNLKGRIELHDTVLSDINKQINILNTNLAILTEKIDNLTNIIKEVKDDRQLQSK